MKFTFSKFATTILWILTFIVLVQGASADCSTNPSDYIFYDDFEDGTFDAWSVDDSGSKLSIISSGQANGNYGARLHMDGVYDDPTMEVTFTSQNDYTVEYYISHNYIDSSDYGFWSGYQAKTVGPDFGDANTGWGGVAGYWAYNDGSSWHDLGILKPTSLTQYQKVKIRYTSDNVSVSVDDSDFVALSGVSTANKDAFSIRGRYQGTTDYYFDTIMIYEGTECPVEITPSFTSVYNDTAGIFGATIDTAPTNCSLYSNLTSWGIEGTLTGLSASTPFNFTDINNNYNENILWNVVCNIDGTDYWATTDILGNSADGNYSTTINVNDAPTQTILTPANGTHITVDNFELTFNSTDPDGDELTYSIYKGGVFVANQTTDETYNFTSLTDGRYNFSVDVSDGSNPIVTGDIYYYTIDTTLPLIVFTYPTTDNTTAIGTDTFSVNVTASDIYIDVTNLTITNSAGVTVYTNETDWVAGSSLVHIGDSITLPASGLYDVELCANDYATDSPIEQTYGIYRMSETRVAYIDTIEQTDVDMNVEFIEIDDKDKDKDKDKDEKVKTKIELDNKKDKLDYDVEVGTDGRHFKFNVTIKNYKKIDDPTIDDIKTKDLGLRLKYHSYNEKFKQKENSLKACSFYTETKHWHHEDLISEGFECEVTYVSDYDVWVDVIVPDWDALGDKVVFDPLSGGLNVNCVSTEILYDNVAPVIGSITPTNNSNNSDLVNSFAFSVTELYPSTAELFINSSLTASQSYVNGSNAFVNKTVNEGWNTFYITANDTAGNIATSSIYNLLIDTTVPTVTQNSPINVSSTTDTYLLNVTATDIHLDSCDILVDDVVVQTNTSLSNPSTLIYQTGVLTAGVHTWNASCTDYFNNTNSQSTIINIIAPSVGIVVGGGAGGGSFQVCPAGYTLVDGACVDIDVVPDFPELEANVGFFTGIYDYTIDLFSGLLPDFSTLFDPPALNIVGETDAGTLLVNSQAEARDLAAQESAKQRMVDRSLYILGAILLILVGYIMFTGGVFHTAFAFVTTNRVFQLFVVILIILYTLTRFGII